MKRKIVFEGREIFISFEKKKIEKKEIEKEVVHFPNTVAILPQISKDKFVLVRQYRFPAKKDVWETPAGKLKKGEKPIEGAKRELKEETGFSAKIWKKLTEYFVSPGYTTEYQYLFLANDLKKGKQKFDENEVIKKVKVFNLKEILKMIKERKILDMKTILAIYLLKNLQS